MANETISEQRPAAPETPPTGDHDHDADIRATLGTLDDALRCAISALPGLSTPGTLAQNLHVAVRAASDVRGLLDIGEPETEDYDPTNVRAAVSALTRQAVDMQHEIGVLRSELGLNGSRARPRSAGYPAQAEPDDLPSPRAEAEAEADDPEDGSLVLSPIQREDILANVLAIETAWRTLFDDVEDDGDTLKQLQSIARSTTSLRCNLGLGEVSS